MQVKIFCRAKKVNRMPWDLDAFYFHIPNSSSTDIMNSARFEVPTDVLLKIQVFWDVTPCLWDSSS
jgi:hypothetical protein